MSMVPDILSPWEKACLRALEAIKRLREAQGGAKVETSSTVLRGRYER